MADILACLAVHPLLGPFAAVAGVDPCTRLPCRFDKFPNDIL